ncbi:hypothetical protein EGW08_017247, partial [Elysia chlorotica]
VKDDLVYQIQAFEEKYHLVLTHNRQLINPGCIIETRNSSGKVSIEPCFNSSKDQDGGDNDCFYTGVSSNHNGSTVAMTTCSGLHGVISDPNSGHDLIIQPIKRKHASRVRRSSGADNPHIIMKREKSSSSRKG